MNIKIFHAQKHFVSNFSLTFIQGQGDNMESVVRLYDIGRLRAEEEDQEEEEDDRNEDDDDDSDDDDADMDQDDCKQLYM